MTSGKTAESLATSEIISTYSKKLPLEIIFGKQIVQTIKICKNSRNFLM